MKLAAVYNTWNDLTLLRQSIANIRPLVDVVIVVFSRKSNTGETHDGPDGSVEEFEATNVPIFFVQHEPNLKLNQRDNETAKRNRGVDYARSLKCTHFVALDSDEFYEPEEFLKAKKRFTHEPNLKGLVCPLNVYFKSPELTIGRDITLVPFIHVLTPTIKHEFNRNYPFAWINGQIRIDPTRSLNINSGVEYTEQVVMHHMSYVREDLELKIRNSTARANLERSTIREDFNNAKPGYFCKFYQKTLEPAPNIFGIKL
jgi:hypothetical protein